jgi:hypothetical protein
MWHQNAYIKASNPDADDYFGVYTALSADGRTLAVGAHGEDSASVGIGGDESDNSYYNSGAMYLFRRNTSGEWSQEAYIKAGNPDTGDGFGRSNTLSADGNTLAVGALREDSAATGIDGDQDNNSATDAGAVYVFSRNSSAEWRQQAYIKAGNADSEDVFGWSPSLSSDGNTLAVAAQTEDSSAMGINNDPDDNSANNAGAAYLFNLNSSGEWRQQAYIKANNTEEEDLFGRSLFLSADGQTLAVGAVWEDSAATGINGNQSDNSIVGAGAVYLY